jgi:hypothetical protein
MPCSGHTAHWLLANPILLTESDLQDAKDNDSSRSLHPTGNTPLIDLVLSQLTDVFRIGLIVALVITMLRTSPVTGRVLPLAAGVVFVAVILPTTMPGNSGNLTYTIIAGLLSNTIILVPVLVVVNVVNRLRR